MSEGIEKNFRPKDPEKKGTHEVSTAELVSTFVSTKYKKRLEEVWTSTLNSETEVSFAIGKEFTSGLIKFGETHGSGDFNSVKEVLVHSLGEEWSEEYIIVAHLHTHPPGALIRPSFEDLTSLFRLRKIAQTDDENSINYYPIMQIVTAPEGNLREQVDILLLQEKPKDTYRTPDHAEMMEDWFQNSVTDENNLDPASIARIINESPFIKAELLSFKRNPKTGKLQATISKADLEKKLERFSYKIEKRKISPEELGKELEEG